MLLFCLLSLECVLHCNDYTIEMTWKSKQEALQQKKMRCDASDSKKKKKILCYWVMMKNRKVLLSLMTGKTLMMLLL